MFFVQPHFFVISIYFIEASGFFYNFHYLIQTV